MPLRGEAQIISYDARNVVYVVVPVQPGLKWYVGIAKGTAFERHTHRIQSAYAQVPPPALSPFEQNIRSLGSQGALHQFTIIILDVVSEHEGDFETYAKPYERFWVAALHSALNGQGWSVEHAPPSLRRDTRGKLLGLWCHRMGLWCIGLVQTDGSEHRTDGIRARL